jgi:hypothetical protein
VAGLFTCISLRVMQLAWRRRYCYPYLGYNMDGSMKTTVDIADPVLREARKVAAREGTTVRSLIEEGLRRILTEKRQKARFRLRLVTAGGRGLRPELQGAGWDEIRDLIYERGEGDRG